MGRWSRAWIVCISAFILVQLASRWMAIEDRIQRIRGQHPQFPLLDYKRLPDPSLKTILLWNSVAYANFIPTDYQFDFFFCSQWFHMDEAMYFGTGGEELFIEAGCPETRCFVSNDRYLMPPDEYDAILFFFPMVKHLIHFLKQKIDKL